ncbi:MAG: GAF domain-containing protein [Actinomycetota bacterium]|nr:GAF domain-containing protein [Actinomycetota bacterium]
MASKQAGYSEAVDGMGAPLRADAVGTSREQQLAMVLQEFTRTLVTDFPIGGILDQLVYRVVELLPVSSAGVTLISPGRDPHYVAASDPSARRYEELQTEIGEGPCVEACRTGTSVAPQDLDQTLGYPMFVPAALDAGLRAVFAFPLCHQERRLGALDLYRKSPGRLDSWEMQTAQTLADVATAYPRRGRLRTRPPTATGRARCTTTDTITSGSLKGGLLRRGSHERRRLRCVRPPAPEVTDHGTKSDGWRGQK